MSNSPAISFAVPYFNNKNFLRETLESIQRQSVQDFEVVVVDDAGPEPADQVIEQMNDCRFRYVRNRENLGLAQNWNKAFHLTRAPYVTILHADDRIHPDYAQTMIDLLNGNPAAAAAHCLAEIIDVDGEGALSFPDIVKRVLRPKGTQPIYTTGPDGLASLIRGSWVYCPSLCFRRSMFPSPGFDPEFGFVVDLDLMVRILEEGRTIIGLRHKMLEYRRHQGAQTSILNQNLLRFEEETEYYRSLADHLGKIGWSKAARVARHRVVPRLNLLQQIMKLILLRQRFDLRRATHLLLK